MGGEDCVDSRAHSSWRIVVEVVVEVVVKK